MILVLRHIDEAPGQGIQFPDMPMAEAAWIIRHLESDGARGIGIRSDADSTGGGVHAVETHGIYFEGSHGIYFEGSPTQGGHLVVEWSASDD